MDFHGGKALGTVKKGFKLCTSTLRIGNEEIQIAWAKRGPRIDEHRFEYTDRNSTMS